jgi:hypothetical protein
LTEEKRKTSACGGQTYEVKKNNKRRDHGHNSRNNLKKTTTKIRIVITITQTKSISTKIIKEEEKIFYT